MLLNLLLDYNKNYEVIYALLGYSNPKIGPGSYLNNMMINPRTNFERSFLNGSQIISGSINTFGKTDRRLLPHSETTRKRNTSTRFAENMRKGHKKISSITQNFEESDSDDSYIYSPGPGSYIQVPFLNNTTKSDNSPFQYFGSTSPRFLESDLHKFPGPGTYKETVEIPKKGSIETSVFK